ncbi:MAG: preprotein translocase subunit SecE [Acidobacteria bacterium]|nr:MAG: preprotein translocase subunit SecE [Acidobacteriota bacterium]PIE90126.1 MAG: preprotein translocase subunit SecE [Acidobacteriota bacterium]
MANYIEQYKAARKELKKVRWPDAPTVKETSALVGVATVIFAAYLYVVDMAFIQFFRTFLFK